MAKHRNVRNAKRVRNAFRQLNTVIGFVNIPLRCVAFHAGWMFYRDENGDLFTRGCNNLKSHYGADCFNHNHWFRKGLRDKRPVLVVRRDISHEEARNISFKPY